MNQRTFFIGLCTSLCLSCVLLFILASPKEQIPNQQVDKVPVIKAEDLKSRLLSEDKDFVLLDTRSVKEYKSGHLEDARFVNFETFTLKEVGDIPKDKEIIVYCLSGGRSNRVGMQLLGAGYEKVHNLEGGISSWNEKKYPIVHD